MRCLTLANALKVHGADSYFICRGHPGNLSNSIRLAGFSVVVLPAPEEILAGSMETRLADEYASWLGCPWEVDAQQTAEALVQIRPDWLVIDHYAIGYQWQDALRSYCAKLFVIDDLANRAHRCDLLLDQTLGRSRLEYGDLVPVASVVLAGAQYALLRPEFALLRSYSVQRRRLVSLPKKILITLGGMDKDNATEVVLEALERCKLPVDCRVVVVMGEKSPWLAQVTRRAKHMPWATQVLVNVRNMAQHMADSDFAIGAAGSTSWERCCLGVPSLMTVLAGNQLPSAIALEKAGAAILLGCATDIAISLPDAMGLMLQEEGRLQQMSVAAAGVTDGLGVERVIGRMGELSA